jgi:hypothetical protein
VVKAHVRRLRKIERQLKQTPDQPISLTDPEARSMATSGRGTGLVGYNVQTAVDTQHHMIVAHEVTNLGHDRTQLAAMATAARNAIGHKDMTALADRGYFKGEEILRCEHAGIKTLVPKPLTSGSNAEGRFDQRDFVYIARRDEYHCPEGARAIWRQTTVENGMALHRYWPSACQRCPIKSQCTTGGSGLSRVLNGGAGRTQAFSSRHRHQQCLLAAATEDERVAELRACHACHA